VTGASGGMVGASFWVASLCAGKNAFRTDGVTGDGLTAVARRLAFGDVPLAFLPLANEDNRGQALEDAWRVHGGPALDMTFAELRGGEQDGRWPSLVFSPILVEDGRRLLIIQIRANVSALSVNPDREAQDRARIGAADTRARRVLRGLEGFTTPPEGLLAARESVMLFRNDADLEALTRLCDERVCEGF